MPSPVHYLAVVDEAGLAAITGEWLPLFPQMAVLAMLPEAEKSKVTFLQQFFSGKGIPLMGGIFPELIAHGRFHRNGCWLLRFDEAPFYLLQENLPSDREGVERMAEEVCGQLRPSLAGEGEATLFMLFDAMVPNIASMLDEIYLKLANRVHYAGANAGSETFQPLPCLFDNRRIVSDAVLAILVKSHHGAILEHGYQLPAHHHSATSTDGNRIATIDWRPAFEVYCELVRMQYGVEINRDNFYQYAVHFPFGIVRANHNVLVRIPVALGEDGSLFCVGEVPPHSVLALLEAPVVNSRHTVNALLERLSKLNGGVAGRDLLLFYCAGRRMHLGVGAAEAEVQDMQQHSRAKEVAGALSLGEIGASTLWGYPLFHNATLVASLW